MDPFLGEIRMFAGNYAPENWQLCDGTLLNINEYQALYSLVGTQWGGDGQTTFAAPDLRGRIAVGMGTGTGLTTRTLAQTGGSSAVQLTQANLPAHTHTLSVSNQPANSAVVSQGAGISQPLTGSANRVVRYAPPSVTPLQVTFDPDAISVAAGGNQPHTNLMPWLAIQYIISVIGLYPERPQ
jgi:microcystin-dependent protein